MMLLRRCFTGYDGEGVLVRGTADSSRSSRPDANAQRLTKLSCVSQHSWNHLEALPGEGVVNAEALRALHSGPLHRFADWPNPDVPAVAIGLYAVWRGPEFIYVGMAGRATEAVLTAAHQKGKACGLRDRLRSHASGRRSGDQFCVLRRRQIGAVSADARTGRGHCRRHLIVRLAGAAVHSPASRVSLLRLRSLRSRSAAIGTEP